MFRILGNTKSHPQLRHLPTVSSFSLFQINNQAVLFLHQHQSTFSRVSHLHLQTQSPTLNLLNHPAVRLFRSPPPPNRLRPQHSIQRHPTIHRSDLTPTSIHPPQSISPLYAALLRLSTAKHPSHLLPAPPTPISSIFVRREPPLLHLLSSINSLIPHHKCPLV